MSLILVDGSALFYRAHFAFARRPLTAPSGETTSVIFGFANSLLRLIDAYKPSHLVVAYDTKGPVFRHEIYEQYKANRKPMPEELAAQLPRLRELLNAWGLPIIEAQDFEADDVIATLCRRSRGVVDKAWIYSGDKDFLQLVDDHTGLLKPGRRGDEVTVVDQPAVEKEYALKPPDLIDVFALSGDSSDNIPGAPGVGPKTALKLIQEHGDLEHLFQHLDNAKITPRLKRILEENHQQVLMSRELFKIRDDVPMDCDWDSFRVRLPESPEARELLESLGLRQLLSLADRLVRKRGAQASSTSAPTPAAEAPPTESDDIWDITTRGYRILEDPMALTDWLSRLQPGAPLAIDTETDSLRTDLARLVGISLASDQGNAVYIPVLLRDSVAQTDLFAQPAETDRLDWIQPLLAPVLASPDHLKIGQNLKFDAWILGRHGLPLAGPHFDTMLAAYVLDPGRDGFGMDDLAREFLSVEPISYKELFDAKDRRRDILDVPLARLGVYAAEDAQITWRLYLHFRDQLAAQPELSALMDDLEMPLMSVLLDMERQGIAIDQDFLRELGVDFQKQIDALERAAHEAAGREFNLQSPKQLAEILFDELKLKPTRKTASGWSTDVGVLEKLADAHPLPKLVLEHRQLAKLRGTYVEALLGLVNPDSGLIHTSFNQAVAATGRLSSSDPNLQNIPIRSENGRMIRRAFVPRREDHEFLSADYSQVELRLLAHLSGDQRLCETFNSGGDVHRRTAALIAGIPEDQVTSAMRYRAKAINFGVIYGMGARALAQQIQVSVREASAFIDSYFKTYPGVRVYIDDCRDLARRTGMSRTLLGRRRLLPDVVSDSPRLRAFNERIAVNTPIQGTAADLIKLAMLRVAQRLKEEKLAALLLLQVHDELLLEVPSNEVSVTADLVREAMTSVMDLAVPLVVDIHTGVNWAEAHD